MRNADVARLLEDIAAALEVRGDSPFRCRAYLEAARTVRNLSVDVAELARQHQLETLPGIGPSIADKIATYLVQDSSPYLEQLVRDIPPAAFDLLRIPGIGPKRAQRLVQELRVTSLADLAQAAREHRIQSLAGLGERTERDILTELERLERRGHRVPLPAAWRLGDELAALMRDWPGVEQAEAAGSLRRRCETVGDLDLLVATRSPERIAQAIAQLDLVREVLVRGPAKVSFLTRDDWQVDVRLVTPEAWGAALVYFTGSKAHNIALRERAIRRGCKVNEYGVFRLADGRKIASRSEAGVYEALGLPWIPPELREDSGEIEAAERGHLPRLISLDEVRGDCHVHTTASDGRNSLEEMVAAAIARGYDFLLVNDHSQGLRVTRGLTPEKAREQWRAIEALNRRVAPFRILKGVELEVHPDGRLDFTPELRREFDCVTASVHSGFKQPSWQLTERMLKALQDPAVRILNHPSGRVVGKRDGYEFDQARVFAEARRLGKALELNGSDRMDLSDLAARAALARGVTLSLGSDAHSVEGLDGMRVAVAIARRAWAGPGQVLNTRTPAMWLARA
jgi:DNA polymerase (family 10)